MKDFLAGTFGKLLQILLVIAGIMLLALSCSVPPNTMGTVASVALKILGVVCFCGVFGIRYWLGNIVRLR
jgi:hypothetical protein